MLRVLSILLFDVFYGSVSDSECVVFVCVLKALLILKRQFGAWL